MGPHFRIAVGQEFLHIFLEAVSGSGIFGHDNHLSMVIFCCLGTEEKDETGRCISDIGGEGGNPFVAVQAVCHGAHHFLCVFNGGTGRQVHVQNDFRTNGRREEFPIHQGQCEEREDEKACHAHNGRFSVMNETFHRFAEGTVSLFLHFHLDGIRFSQFNELVSQNRTDKNGSNPGKYQGGTDDPEKGIGIFCHLPHGQAHGNEAGGSNQGACQHGGGAGLVSAFG